MPTLNDLGGGDNAVTLDNLGAGAGALPQPSYLDFMAQQNARRQADLDNLYIGAMGPESFTGPARGSPAGLPTQALSTPTLALTRERILRELQDNPAVARQFDVNTTAEVGTDPAARAAYQATAIDRAVSRLMPLASAIAPGAGFYPAQTLGATRASGIGVPAALFAGANPAGFATGNASFDPRTGRWVGFAGGPQTATTGAGITRELYGIEGPDLPYARMVGYSGPGRTAIGPAGPQGLTDTVPMGWQETVGASPSGVGYINPAQLTRGAATSPADLAPQPQPEGSSFLQRFMRALGQSEFKPVKPVSYDMPRLVSSWRPTLIGARRGR